MIGKRARVLAMTAGLGVIVLGTAPVPAAAQVDDARVRKIEAEVRALQRKVFPGGDGRFFEADSAAAAPQTGLPPATTAVTDILARLDALEAQLARLTSQVETNTNAIATLNAQVARLHPEVAPVLLAPGAAIPAAPGSPVAVPVAPSAAAPPAPVPAPAAAPPQTPPAAVSAPPAGPAVPAAKPAAPSAERLAAVQAIAKPSTGDAGEDEYSYGFRLWDAKLYPEAEQQLRLFVEKYPNHPRISHGRNLLGRAYLDDGKPGEAAPWFLKNYQSDKQGARAGDSLLYLAEAMIAEKDTTRACIALAEFGDTYPALATGRLREQYEANRRKVTCK